MSRLSLCVDHAQRMPVEPWRGLASSYIYGGSPLLMGLGLHPESSPIKLPLAQLLYGGVKCLD